MTDATPAGGRHAAERDWHRAWSAALEALELDVIEAERLLAARGVPGEASDAVAAAAHWVPPVIRAPLPVDLRARAEAILARQLRVADDLVRTMGTNRREAQVARRMGSGTTDRVQPVFVDSQL